MDKTNLKEELETLSESHGISVETLTDMTIRLGLTEIPRKTFSVEEGQLPSTARSRSCANSSEV